jgi:hypothetical protein
MKTLAVIKLFVVLCCYTHNDTDGYKYDVRNAGDSTMTGTIFSFTKYSEGDTIRIVSNERTNN